jgi:putative iron-dependent peroxidase
MSVNLSPLMQSAQAGLFVEPGRSVHYLELQWPKSVTLERLKDALIKALQPAPEVFIAVGFGMDAWVRLGAKFAPKKLQHFTQMEGKNGAQMPSTQGDIWFWIHGEDQGEVMNAVLSVHHAIRNVLVAQQDLNGFKNKEARDLTGFVDGTANPKEDKRGEIAQIPFGEIGAGGSYVFTQKWRHNLTAFNALTVSEQEKVFGRTKVDNIEMRGEAMPKNSHVARTDVKVDGIGQKIYRRSTPFGTAEHHGLYFLAFSCDPDRIQIQLQRMLGNTEDGISDELMKYSKAETGSYWFMPAQQDLNDLLKP